MFDSLQSITLGAAAVFDTVLLLTLLERRNWPFVRVPIVAMICGAWAWHAGQFLLVLLTGIPGWWAGSLLAASALLSFAGLLLMPCGLLHGTWRVWALRVHLQPRPFRRHLFAYLPMLLLIPLSARLFRDAANFSAVAAPLELPYLLFVGVVNVAATTVFLRCRHAVDEPQAATFFVAQSLTLLAMTLLQVFGFWMSHSAAPESASAWKLAMSLSPLAPALLFVYFVIRFQFFQIILERSLVYGVLLGGTVLLHQVLFQDVSAAIPESYRLHVVVLEAVVLATLVLAYQPLRQRFAEALRYLMGARVSVIRENLRQLSRELSTRAGTAPDAMLRWFVAEMQRTLEVRYVIVRLFRQGSEPDFRTGAAEYWNATELDLLARRMRETRTFVAVRSQVRDAKLRVHLQAGRASLAVFKERETIAGLLVIGRGNRQRDLSEEETNAILLLVEQLAISLDNSLLQADRLAAERKAMQSEKLSALGLLASSIAHEVKNPLSAIKTIASVLAEDLGPEDEHAEDLRIILGEVDRLAATTAQLLEMARPRPRGNGHASVPGVLTSTLHLLRHLAREQGICVAAELANDLPAVQADENSLREIFFNLLSNSLEAAGAGGSIHIGCRRENGFVVTCVQDSGPGIEADILEHLFEPFLTTKPRGTGLGLYVVGQRVGELGGTIHCDSRPGQGTSFTVKLPCETS